MNNSEINPTNTYAVPSVSITTACTGVSSKANEMGMRVMQERAYAKRGEQYLLIKSPPASGKSPMSKAPQATPPIKSAPEISAPHRPDPWPMSAPSK